MKVLVTGAGGLIGQRLVPELLKKYTVLGVSRTPLDYHILNQENRYIPIQADLNQAITINKENYPEVIIHLAGVPAGKNMTEVEYIQYNKNLTEKVIQYAELWKVERLIFASSSSVYGESEEVCLESSKLGGQSGYALSKVQSEKLILESGVPYTILRISSVYGSGMNSFINKLYRFAQRGFFPSIIGKQPKKSVLFINDLVWILNSCIEKRGDHCILNAASGLPVTLEQIYQLLKVTIGKRIVKIPISGKIESLVQIMNRLLFKLHMTKNEKFMNVSPLFQSSMVSTEKLKKEFPEYHETDLANGILKI